MENIEIKVNNDQPNRFFERFHVGHFPQAQFSVVNLGEIGLPEADRLLSRLTQMRASDLIPDLLLLLAHYPALAVGARKMNEMDLLKPLQFFQQQRIEIYQSMRGGGLTYHWPGQLVVYPVLKLTKPEQNLSNFMFRLEEVALRTLKDLGVVAQRKRDQIAQIGLWVGEDKIASMGTYISNWITSYGFALNLSGDYRPATFIRPCGLDVQFRTVADITGIQPDRKMVEQWVVYHFVRIFNRQLVPSISIENDLQPTGKNLSSLK
ncbi:MAG: lipoyl(octanoyl) transferase LipB [bacterium]|nr:lipoyl(octanoyl) transferase LipB [bacterium]